MCFNNQAYRNIAPVTLILNGVTAVGGDDEPFIKEVATRMEGEPI